MGSLGHKYKPKICNLQRVSWGGKDNTFVQIALKLWDGFIGAFSRIQRDASLEITTDQFNYVGV
jgi:hypothetical protein